MTTDTLSGRTIGKYRIVEKIGSGGMAEVYLAVQKNLDRHVAIKFMHAFLISEQDFLNRFEREAKAMARLNHPNIVGVYDFDVYGENSYYLVMEYINGGTLKEKLAGLAQAGERLPLEQAIQFATEVADALAYAHQREMVHRDIKPANIMIDETGKAVLTDFGIVKMMGNQAMAYTATGALIGTPAYMSPEQALGKSGDARLDIYSLGVLLFQMATGQLPYDADTPLAVVMKHVNEPTPLPGAFNPDVPYQLQEAILKAMAKNPDERFQTANEFAAALRQIDLSAKSPLIPVEGAMATRPQGRATASMPPQPETAVGGITDTAASPTAVGRTAIATPEELAPLPKKKRPIWLYLIIALIVIGSAAGGLLAAGVIPGLRPTPTTAAIAVEPTNTAAAATNTPMPNDTPIPEETRDIAADIFATLTAVAAALPTETPTPTNTPTLTPSPTPNATATYLAGCAFDAELVAAYPYSNSRFNSVPTEARNFTMNWALKNSGTCPWPAGLTWKYADGEAFGYDDEPLVVEGAVAVGEEISLQTSFPEAPDSVGTFEATWQLFDADGEPFGPALSFELRTYNPVTATPATPPTNTPAPTSEELGPITWISSVDNASCEYLGGANLDWRCRITITPYRDGSSVTHRYTLEIFDQPGTQPTRYTGTGTFTHWIQARRCAEYIHEIKIIDEDTGEVLTDNIYVNPQNHFAGGCVEP